MKRKKYNPERGYRSYDASVAENGFKYDIGTSAIWGVVAFLVVDLIILFFPGVQVYFTYMGIITIFAMILYTIIKMVRQMTLRRAFLANGGQFHSEQGKKHLRKTRIFPIIGIVLSVLLLAVLIDTVTTRILDLTGLEPSYIVFMAVFCAYSFLGINSPGSVVSTVIFGEKSFLSGFFEVRYNGLSVTKKTYSKESPLAVAFHKDGAQVGHDMLYWADYEYLCALLERFNHDYIYQNRIEEK
jgi:hypothetical protein